MDDDFGDPNAVTFYVDGIQTPANIAQSLLGMGAIGAGNYIGTGFSPFSSGGGAGGVQYDTGVTFSNDYLGSVSGYVANGQPGDAADTLLGSYNAPSFGDLYLQSAGVGVTGETLVGSSVNVASNDWFGPASTLGWTWNFSKSLFSWKGFSAGFKQGGCVRQFAADTANGFVNSFLPPSPSPGEIVGVGTAMYDYPNEVGIVAEQHLAQYGSRISNYTIGEQAGARAGFAGLLANADYQAAIALVDEYGSATSGQCK